MKGSRFWWLNIVLILTYAAVALFVNGNGQVLGLSTITSKALIHTLQVAGFGFATYSLLKWPKEWPVPALCLIVYLAFVL